jgi:hypothetical protein
MAFQISPGVNVSEVDQTTVVPSVLTTAGAIAGNFKWGPADVITQIDNEITLVKTFGKPDSTTATTFFTAANFLSYGNNLSVVRAVSNTAINSTADTTVLIKNSEQFQATYLNQNNGGTYGAFAARYPGTLGSSISVAVCDNATDFATWTYKNYFTTAPSTSDQVSAAQGSDDEMHIVVIDTGGLLSGTKGTVLETYAFVSKAIDATVNGASNYYKQVIFNDSKYVYAMDPPDYSTQVATWGHAISTEFTSLPAPELIQLSGGVDGTVADGFINSAYDLFANKELVDISLILTGASSNTVQNHVITSIAAARGDCIAFVSPPSSAVVNQAGTETTKIATWLSQLGTTST